MAGTDILKDIKNSRPNWPRVQLSKKKYYAFFFFSINAGFLHFTEFLGELTKYQGAQTKVTVY